uniref:Uncharacterized protein n=1 Tax=Anguilla anguilla TaxID=7936 RepID=A0A0E9VNE2_ANGAN
MLFYLILHSCGACSLSPCGNRRCFPVLPHLHPTGVTLACDTCYIYHIQLENICVFHGQISGLLKWAV